MRMFTGAETWSGGRIELLVALGPSSPERQLKALQAIWGWRPLRGPYLQSKIEPEYQAQIEAVLGEHCTERQHCPTQTKLRLPPRSSKTTMVRGCTPGSRWDLSARLTRSVRFLLTRV